MSRIVTPSAVATNLLFKCLCSIFTRSSHHSCSLASSLDAIVLKLASFIKIIDKMAMIILLGEMWLCLWRPEKKRQMDGRQGRGQRGGQSQSRSSVSQPSVSMLE